MATVQRKKSLVAMAIAVSALCSGASRADADTYVQTNLASDITGLATVTDPLLVNTWGLVGSAAGSPFWISKGHQYIHSLCGDRRHKRQQGDGRKCEWLCWHSDNSNRTTRANRDRFKCKHRGIPVNTWGG